ncbi:phage portal protein [Variovorax sp. EBFNA2]|uniref:phage portal protein n=1 Tax=Variovorax sp. EBFNA2 TaxID=3342097 RepID=UPI0029C004FC|nr:phage portal protein [Variovorax boronicumulans]WPG35141.1 phage portal protein [Variovorax boronicumulans]
MAYSLASFIGWFGWGSGALAERIGQQQLQPATAIVPNQPSQGVDSALQISTVWACIDRRATLIASLPFFAYDQTNGQKTLARSSRLFGLLHESPNGRMTPFEFWRAMMMNHDLRGNAYARVDRDERTGEAISLWPMPADQVEVRVLDDGTMVYAYRLGDDLAVLAESSVLHLKNLGNGTMGLSKLEFMRASMNEAVSAQGAATTWFANGGKPTGVLMIDRLLTKEQRATLKVNFADLADGSTSRLKVLEADMKYAQVSMTPEQQQLLETRKYGVEELCRWYDTPPVLVHHANVTAWGTGIEQIFDGFYKLTIRPMAVNIEQAVRKRVMTPAQRARMAIEFNLDALLRGNAKDRAEIAAKKVQNGLATRNEMRQLENEQPLPGGDVLTVQANLLPIALLGKVKPTISGGTDASSQDPQAQ